MPKKTKEVLKIISDIFSEKQGSFWVQKLKIC